MFHIGCYIPLESVIFYWIFETKKNQKWKKIYFFYIRVHPISSLKIRFRQSRHFFKLRKSMLKLEAKYLLLPNPKYFKLTSNMKKGYLSTLKYILKCLIFMFSVINFKIYRNGCTVCWHLVWGNSQIVDFVFTITKCAHKNITIPSPDCRNIFVNPARRMRGRSSSPRWRSYLPILQRRGRIN